MHPDDQRLAQKFKEDAARLRASQPPNPKLEQDIEEFHVDPRRDHPAFSPKTQQNLNTLFGAYQSKGKAGLRKKYDELFPDETSPSAPVSAPSKNR